MGDWLLALTTCQDDTRLVKFLQKRKLIFRQLYDGAAQLPGHLSQLQWLRISGRYSYRNLLITLFIDVKRTQ